MKFYQTILIISIPVFLIDGQDFSKPPPRPPTPISHSGCLLWEKTPSLKTPKDSLENQIESLLNQKNFFTDSNPAYNLLIDEMGRISEHRILIGINSNIDSLILNILEQSKWNPGICMGGDPKETWLSIPLKIECKKQSKCKVRIGPDISK